MDESKHGPITVYRRSYSELEGLQHAEQVTYALHETDGTLCLCARRAAARGPVRCKLPGADAAFAARLLCFLYENAVAPEQMPDVVRDLCGAPG